MRFHRERSAQHAGTALAVLLVHVALAWLVLLSSGIPRQPVDDSAIIAVLLPQNPPATGDSLPQITPKLRMPRLPNPDTALEVPIEVPVEIPTDPQPITPSIIATTPLPAPQPPIPASGSGIPSEGTEGIRPGPRGYDVLHLVQPVYPVLSVRRREEGTVAVAFTVDAKGRPVKVRIKKSSGFDRLDDAALACIRQWRFQLRASAPAKPEEFILNLGFHLKQGLPAEFQALVVHFKADLVAQINASTERTHDGDAPDEEAVRGIISGVIDSTIATNTSVDHSPVVQLRLIGAVQRRPDVEVAQAAGDSRTEGLGSERLWYAFAVQQGNSTSEWLFALGPKGAINAVEVIAGGPPCSAAAQSAACAPAR